MKLQLPTLWHCSQGWCLAQREPRCCSLVSLYPGDHISQAPPGGTNLILKGPVSIFRGKPTTENYFCLQRPPCPSCSRVCLGSRMLSVPISFHGWVPISLSKNRHHPRVFLPPPVVVKPTAFTECCAQQVSLTSGKANWNLKKMKRFLPVGFGGVLENASR